MNGKFLELWLAANAMRATKDVLGGYPTDEEWDRLRRALTATKGEVDEWIRKHIPEGS